MKRRHALKLGCAALLRSAAGSPAGCSRRRRAARDFCWCSCAAATTPRNLLYRTRAASITSPVRTSPSPVPMPASSTGALALNADWALAPAVRETDRRPVSAAPGGLRPVRRHGRSVAQPFRDPGQHRARPAARSRAQLPLRLSRATGGGLAGTAPEADPIAFTDALPLAFEGAAHGTESVAQERRQTAFRRAPGGHPERHVCRTSSRDGGARRPRPAPGSGAEDRARK